MGGRYAKLLIVTAAFGGLTAAMATGSGPAAIAAEAPMVGDAGVGDALFPTLGNGGYDVRQYDLDLRYATADEGPLTGDVTIRARATQSLPRFDLDYGGDGISAVMVDGRPARWSRSGTELVISPSRALRRGAAFTVVVRSITVTPKVPSAQAPLAAPFFRSADGTGTAGQPAGVHELIPCNDHPSDKAAFRFRLDVPAGTTAVANGVLTGRVTRQGRTVWTYRQDQPMATELLQLTVGDYDVVPRRSVAGVMLRDVVPRRSRSELDPKLAAVSEHLPWMVATVGPYPFDVYGSLVAKADLGFALETQTLSLYDSVILDLGRATYEPIMVHELAHEWFGNSVTPERWEDLWLSEASATYYHLVYAAERGLLGDHVGVPGIDLEGYVRQLYDLGDSWRAEFGPVGAPRGPEPARLFSRQMYFGGALVMYALRQELGRRTFVRLEQTWARQYAGRSVSTADFAALASRIAGRDLRPFLNAWVYGATTPPMPGRPDWKSDPVASSPR